MAVLLLSKFIIAKAASDEYTDYGCIKDIELYASQSCVLEPPFPYLVNCEWYIRKVYEYSYDEKKITQNGSYGGIYYQVFDWFKSVKFVSYSSTESAFYKWRVYCKQTTVYVTGRKSIEECYWNVTWKEREKITITATPDSGTVNKGTKVYLNTNKPNTTIYYTTNGSIPSENSSVYSSTGITIDKSTTIRAIAYNDDNDPKYISSGVCSWTYTVKTPVESIKLDREELKMVPGQTETVKSTVYPDNATDKSVTWGTSDSSVVTITNGFVSAVGAGTATITVTTTDGSKTAACEVTVN